jgi:putative spermidine/putrescine transport system permease protein
MKNNKQASFWSWLWIILGYLYFLIPLIATFDFSLRAKKGGLSLLAYERVLRDPAFWNSFLFSMEMALLTVVFSVLLVVPTAFWIHLKFPQLRALVEFITLLPFVVPAIVLVFGLLRIYSGTPFYLTNTIAGTNVLLVASYMVLALPYMYRSVDNGLRAIDIRTLTEAAQSMGAGWGTILIRIILPNLRSAILSGMFLTVAIVMGEFTIASFLVGLNAFGPYMSQVGLNKAYESSSLAIISFILTWTLMGIIQFITRKNGSSAQIGGAR